MAKFGEITASSPRASIFLSVKWSYYPGLVEGINEYYVQST